jgi:hypothetical protein
MKKLLIIIAFLIKFFSIVLGLGIILTTIGNLYNLPTPSVLDCILIEIGGLLITFKINFKL